MPFYRKRRRPEFARRFEHYQVQPQRRSKGQFIQGVGGEPKLSKISNVLLYRRHDEPRYSNNAGERCKVTEVHQPHLFGPDIQDGERRYRQRFTGLSLPSRERASRSGAPQPARQAFSARKSLGNLSGRHSITSRANRRSFVESTAGRPTRIDSTKAKNIFCHDGRFRWFGMIPD